MINTLPVTASITYGVEILLFSKFAKETEVFYRILGHSFVPSSYDSELIHSKEGTGQFPLLRLISSSESATGFRIVLNGAWGAKTQIDPELRLIEYVQAAGKALSPSVFSDRWITVLRAQDLEKTRKFYDIFGDWQKEQHKTGPVHYSKEIHGSLFEIYPLRKKLSSDYRICYLSR